MSRTQIATRAQALLPGIRTLIATARHAASRAVDTLQVRANFEIGRLIVEEEQSGDARAAYGKRLLAELAATLTGEFGRGFSQRNLEYMRRFFLAYRDRLQIAQTPSAQLPGPKKIQSASGDWSTAQTLSAQSSWTLSWSHYVLLLGIKESDARAFYEIEASSEGWSLRELKRQVNSVLYERLALSRDKDAVRALARAGQVIDDPGQMIKNPYVLEFLGLREESQYSERELEAAIIDKIEMFLLELGKGFLFEARQKRFTFDEDHYFIDLVFYNRLLRCYVLIDLKIGELTHQDLGQMQMYVNYFDRHVIHEGERPSVGIILCKDKKDALVELTLPEGTNIHASEYQLYLPSKEELQRKLAAWTKELEA